MEITEEFYGHLLRGCKQSFDILNDPKVIPEYLMTEYILEVIEDLNITIDKAENTRR